jgi:hypothetical protein
MAYIPVAPKYETRRVAFNIIEDLGATNPAVILPPLYMHHNPQTWKLAYKKKTTRMQTFDAHVEFFWGEELDSLSSDATTGGFIKEEVGYTTLQRRETAPFFKFQDILDIYRNNGNTYDEKGRVVRKGSIIVFFDPDTYLGYFETLNWREDANNPYNFFFDFSFKIERSFTGF